MWTYSQKAGTLEHDGNPDSDGYSGHLSGRDNPAMQDVPNVGPIPRGFYTIEKPKDTATHGPFVLGLEPDPSNEMHGRGGFLIHGDSKVDPGEASHGCLVLARVVRERIAASGDNRLEVIA